MRLRNYIGPAIVAGLLLLGALYSLQLTPTRQDGQAGAEQIELAGTTMGAVGYVVKVIAPVATDEARVDEMTRAVQEAMEGVNERMSTYRPDSELSRFNRSDSTEPFPISPDTVVVIAAALRLSASCDGVFDVTVGPLVNLWGFGPDARPEHIPADEEIEQARARVGYRKLTLDEQARTLTKSDPRLYCDLSAIAKGYAVDQVAEALLAMGYPDHMVEIGGEVRTGGTNLRGEPWHIAIEQPDVEGRAAHRVVAMSNTAMATSGDYRNYYEEDGQRFSHTLDPRTGHPIQHRLASVSVVHPSCMMADGLATLLMVLGPDEGLAFAEREAIAAYFIVRSGDQFTTKATTKFDVFTSLHDGPSHPAPEP